MADKVESLEEARAKRGKGGKGGRRKTGGKKDPGGDGCPVVALGHRNGEMVYLSPAGEQRRLGGRDHKYEQLLALFGADETWLTTHCPAYDQNGNAVGWSVRAATRYLMGKCFEEGLYDDRMPVHGVGVWRRPDNSLAINAGNALWIDGGWQRAGQKLDGAIYTAAPPRERPSEESADIEQAGDLMSAIRLWSFEEDYAADLVCGFIGAAMLGGAPSWRVHMLVTGEGGSGKSELSRLVSAALGGGGSDANNTTEAAIRQMMTDESGAIILDEAESDESTASRINAVIQLLRLMSSGAGAKVQRGSAGGKAVSFSVTGCAWLAAILPPPLKPQDRSRIAHVRLRKINGGEADPDGAEEARQAVIEMAELSPMLRARAIAGWPRFLATFALYRDAFLRAGCDGRDSDRISTLLAGRDLLLRDDEPPEDLVNEAPVTYRALIVESQAQIDESEGSLCLNRLLTSNASKWRGGGLETVSDMVMHAAGQGQSPVLDNEQIGRAGLRLMRDDAGDLWLLVANRHEGLEHIFAGSRWAGGGWCAALRYLSGAQAATKPIRFGGVPSRATMIPQAFLPRESESE